MSCGNHRGILFSLSIRILGFPQSRSGIEVISNLALAILLIKLTGVWEEEGVK